jgi:flagellin
MDMQIGANQGQQLGIRIPKISSENLGISTMDMTTAEGANKAIDQIDNAIKYVSNARSGLGAYQNRLEHTISSLDITTENMTSAYSQIMDVDMAEEMTEYTTLQVLTQASTSMLAQANERPSQVLQLLQ